MSRLLLVINPISGTRSKAGLAEQLEARLTAMDHDVTTACTTGPGDATRLAAMAVEQGYDGVLACGGDGTVNETAMALCDTPVALGIIPAGSGNGLARHLGIACDPMLALDVIAENHIEACDYASVADRKFFCTFGLGLDAAVSHRFARQSRRGKITYIRSAVEEYLTYKPRRYTITIGGKVLTEDALIVTVCNASQYGNNAYIAPQASITDGLLDVVILHRGNLLQEALVGIELMAGYLDKNTLVTTIRTSAATISRNGDTVAHIDGEPIEMPDTVDVLCHPGALRMYTHAHHMPLQPVITPLEVTCSDLVRDLRHFLHI